MIFLPLSTIGAPVFHVVPPTPQKGGRWHYFSYVLNQDISSCLKIQMFCFYCFLVGVKGLKYMGSLLREIFNKISRSLDRWKLKWKDHIHTVESKIAKNLGFLYQEKHFLDEHCFKQICFTYAHAYLNYANIICASTHKTKLKKVQSNLKHDSRIIFNQSKTSSSKSFFIGLNVPKVDRINIFQSVQFMHR